MSKIKVLHISEPFVAGVYKYIKDICHFFEGNTDFDQHVIYSPSREGTSIEKIEADFNDVSLYPIEMQRSISPIKDFKAMVKIYKTIKSIKPDIIHLHSSKAGIIGRIAGKLYSKAEIYYTPNGYAFVREDISSIKKKLFFLIEKYATVLLGGTTLACGDTEYDLAKKIGPSQLIRNGIIPDSFGNLPKNSQQVQTIGSVGRLSNQKNPQLFNKIAECFPDIQFVWVGDGELRHELTSNNIIITGWKSNKDVIQKVKEFDVFIQTSLWEGLPFTILEAMALRKPIVATDVIGNKDAVEHGYNGFLCSSLDDFKNAVVELTQNKDLRNQMEANSRKRVVEFFDQNKNFKQLEMVYASAK